MKSPQQIAADRYPYMEQSENTGEGSMLFNERQEMRREAFIAGMQDKEKEAIEFAEWLEFSYWQLEQGIWVDTLDEPETKRFTTKELYNRFKQDK